MLTNIIFFICGVLITASVFLLWTKTSASGELQVDEEKEILQVAFYSPDHLKKALAGKTRVTFRLVKKPLEWKVPQE